MIRRVLAVLAICAAVLLTSGGAAQADININPLGDCKGDPPIAQAPGTGASGLFVTRPKTLPTGPTFVDGVPSYAHYGVAGMEFHTYDLGCGPDAFRDPGAVTGTMAGNWMMELTRFGTTATGAFLSAAYEPTYMHVFDGLLVTGVETLARTIYDHWAPVALMVVGLLLIFRAKSGSWASTVTVVTWALLVMVVATIVISYPVRAGSVADGTVAKTLGAVNEGINGGNGGGKAADQASTALTSAVLWEEWKMGTFGSSDSPTALKYAIPLYKAQSLTWAEAQKASSSPAAGEAMFKAKADQWSSIADKIKQSDPTAYEHLTGKSGATRFGAGIVSIAAAIATIPFLLFSALLLMGSYLVIRMVVLFFPLIATIGIAHPARGAVIGMGAVVAAALINSLMFGVAAAVTTLAARTLLMPGSGIPLWLALGLMLLFSLIMWILTKPLRRLTTLANPSKVVGNASGAVGDAWSRTKSGTLGAVKTAAAAYVGGAGGAAAVNKAQEEREEEARSHETRAEATATSTPAPAPVPVASTSVPAPQGLPAGVGAQPMPGPTPAPTTPPLQPTGIPTTPAYAAPGLPAGPSVPTPPTVQPTSTSTPDVDTSATMGPVFVPGADAHVSDPVSLPPAVNPTIDDTTGEEVYRLFDATAVDAGTDTTP